MNKLNRRHDLIPNLVATVKGYAAHERGTFEAVTATRASAIDAGKGGSLQQQAQAENVLTGALKSLFAVAEAYPDLKANQNFVALQEQLTTTEDRLANFRRFYNDSVLIYNTRIQTFPRTLVAGPLHFTSREFFDAEARGSGIGDRSVLTPGGAPDGQRDLALTPMPSAARDLARNLLANYHRGEPYGFHPQYRARHLL